MELVRYGLYNCLCIEVLFVVIWNLYAGHKCRQESHNKGVDAVAGFTEYYM